VWHDQGQHNSLPGQGLGSLALACRPTALNSLLPEGDSQPVADRLAASTSLYNPSSIATRGELLLELSQREQAHASVLGALQVTHNHAELSLLTRRLLE
jgi:hypothetical protein